MAQCGQNHSVEQVIARPFPQAALLGTPYSLAMTDHEKAIAGMLITRPRASVCAGEFLKIAEDGPAFSPDPVLRLDDNWSDLRRVGSKTGPEFQENVSPVRMRISKRMIQKLD